MRRFTIYSIVMIGLLIVNTGCQTGPKKQPREPYTAANNPTVNAGRGEPSLDDVMRPAAWVLVDGHEGKYVEEDGNPHVEWVIKTPVSRTPSFQAEVATDLLGTPTEFKCALKSRSSEQEGPVGVYYGIAANEGTFEVGKLYSLVSPGKDFVIRNAAGEIIDEIGPLPPGDYLVAAGLKNSDTGKEALAITYFTVQ